VWLVTGGYGAAVPGTAHVGCSGWSYPHWRGRAYPPDAPPRRWFGIYAERFDTVELNATFYRLPSESTVRSWADQAPAGFTYAVKVSRFATHQKKLKDPGGWVRTHVERMRDLGRTWGPNLLQLPPRWRRDTGRLDEALAALPGERRWAVELRDPSWVHDDVLEVLARHEVALCIHDLIEDHPWELTTDWTYLRFHGPAARSAPYQGRYTGRRLWRVADRLEGWLADGCDVFAYFNNDEVGHAVEDAAWLADRLEVRGPLAEQSAS
jgi:uncharacterized protein YecE (DUF72 family)